MTKKISKPEDFPENSRKKLVAKKISSITRCNHTGCKIIPAYYADNKYFCEKHFSKYSAGKTVEFTYSEISSQYPGIKSVVLVDGSKAGFPTWRNMQKTQKSRQSKYFDDNRGARYRECKFAIIFAGKENIPVIDYKFPGDNYIYKSITRNFNTYIFTKDMTPIMILDKNGQKFMV